MSVADQVDQRPGFISRRAVALALASVGAAAATTGIVMATRPANAQTTFQQVVDEGRPATTLDYQDPGANSGLRLCDGVWMRVRTCP